MVINLFMMSLVIIYRDIIILAGVILMVGGIGNLITLPLTLYLLRHKKGYLIGKLDTYAPKKLQGWAHFSTSAWIRSSQVAFSWFSLQSKEEIQYWRQGIKKELGRHFFIYWLNAQLLRLSFIGVSMVIILLSLDYIYGITGFTYTIKDLG